MILSLNKKEFNQLNSLFQAFTCIELALSESHNLTSYMACVHEQLKSLLYAENFCLVLLDPIDNRIEFPYYHNEKLTEFEPHRLFTLPEHDESALAWVIHHKKSLYIHSGSNTSTQSFTEDIKISTCATSSKAGAISGFNIKANTWLGMPLINYKDRCLGMIFIENYQDDTVYTAEERQIFKLISSFIVNGVSKYLKLWKSNVAEITRSERLGNKLVAQTQDEPLQNAIFKISALTHETLDLDEFYFEIKCIIEPLLYAENLIICLYDEEQAQISFPYVANESEQAFDPAPIEIKNDIYGYVINTRCALRLTENTYNEMVKSEKFIASEKGLACSSWLGVPMISANILHGIIIVKSFEENIRYTEEDKKVLTYLANHIAISIETSINLQQRAASQINLAKNHRLLEQKNREIVQTLTTLKNAQKELVQNAKMAALGGLVAGIAHEINTPLGICVTGVSHLLEETKTFRSFVEDKKLTESKLMNFIDDVEEVGKILTTNSTRAANLINSFKQVAVDQSSDKIRTFNIKRYIDEIVLSLRPTLKRTKHIINIVCNEHLEATINAGAFSQVLSNLILNSVKHGFENIDKGEITIEIIEQKNSYVLKFSDNGIGVNKEDMEQLFDPFFTTKRSEGGSGLGTHLVYNLVTTSLKGKLKASSEVGEGLVYLIKLAK